MLRLLVPALAALLLLPVAPAAAKLPRGWLGVMADGPLLAGGRELGREFGLMDSVGVQSVRVAVHWDEVQPYPSAAEVPPERAARFRDLDGVPSDLAQLDAIAEAAARAGLDLLPVVLRSPRWAASGPEPGAPPRDPQRYARFVGSLVGRYGPDGSFWRERPGLRTRPIRRWQVWNEPDIGRYWSEQPFAPGYVRLLRAARAAVKARDGRAQVVAAGLTNRSWEDLDRVYRAGGRRAFDAAAIHPFSRRVSNVVKIVRLARGVMRRRGDARKPLILTEVSWTSGHGRSTLNYGWETTERGQAERVEQALTALARERRRLRIGGVFWYTWMSPPPGDDESFAYAGLRRVRGSRVVSKPAYHAFRRVARRLKR